MSFPSIRAPRRLIADAAIRAAALPRRGLLAGAACACCAAGFLRPTRAAANVPAAPSRPLHGRLDEAARAVEPRMIAWRRDIHQHPELGNQEIRTAGLVAEHLRRSASTCATGVARHRRRRHAARRRQAAARWSRCAPTWTRCR